MRDPRTQTRHRVLKAGTIAFNNAGISCRVRNLSATGACLEVVSPIGIPPTFVLAVEADGLKRGCHIVWRKETRIGVQFDENSHGD